MSETYDVVVVGAGPAGYVCAIRAAQLGLRTACVESGSYEGGLGGTCLNWGCIPAKALLESAALAHNLQHHGARMGVKPVEVEYDFPAAVKRSRIITRKLTAGVKYLLGKNKVDIVQGRGRLAGAGRVAVESEGETREIAARNVVFATGSVMQTFPGFELDGEKVIGSREALGLQQLPAKMAIVGAGFVGVEFADVFNAFGVDVTLIEALDTLVPFEDPEIGKALERSFRKRGIRNLTNTHVKHLDRDSSPMVLTVVNPDGSETAEETDLVLMAVGRRPVTENLGLEKNGVAVEDGFIRIDGWCRTNQPGVYAIGDVAGQPMLAHVGSHEGIVAAEHIAGVAKHPMTYGNIPSVGYCHPEVASIGMSVAQAEEAGHEVVTGKYPLGAHGRALTAESADGFVKVVADAKYGELLGVHMIGHNVSELVAEVGMARELEATLDEIVRHAHAHPSMAEAVMEAAFAALGRSIHM
ncbi:dihydrolipoyl dehydrogenase [Candidatus Palauibacter sp.]|uniref:dihydrolipoyl dehydrogenase n=1 Tax=Candidatus Palauibacter sp. TaxID=3101350 RepID=UPI003D133073